MRLQRPPTVVIVRSGEETARAAAELGLPLVNDAREGDMALILDERGWALADPHTRTRPVRCDLLEGELGRRLRQRGGRDERLARAIGARRHPGQRVLDATAGLGRESVLAAALGCEVIACERSPVVAWLLRDGLARASAVPALAQLVARIDLRVADARKVMAALPEHERPDVVLIDPMFPERRGTALAKREMQLLQRLLGAEPDVADLLDVALATARRRVVVKRPAHVEAAGPRPPDILVSGRASRYDVYLVG
jgi:16S rRNA (guanine1516-N2)-methyltransferase